MSFAMVPARTAVFLDANILVYHFGPEPRFGPACTALFQRIENREFSLKEIAVAKPPHVDAVAGEILAHGSDFRHLRVRLTTGEEIVAVLPKMRKFGCLFGTLVGWSVRVVFRSPPKMPRVVDLARPTEHDAPH